MPEGLVELAAQKEKTGDRRIYGVAIAEVINNVDATGLGRVQVRLPWLPGFDIWARLALQSLGHYFVPQVGDEVLVAFNHGDVRDPYVIGCLWNTLDWPPTQIATDALTKRIICTPLQQQIEFDDLNASITITSVAQQEITIGPAGISISTAGGTATVSLDAKGEVAIEAATSIKLSAPKIAIDGGEVSITSKSRTSINGGPNCTIQAAQVKIN